MAIISVFAFIALFSSVMAIYWFGRARRIATDDFLMSRLGGEANLAEERARILRREEHSGLLRDLKILLEDAGEKGRLNDFLVQVGVAFGGTFVILIALSGNGAGAFSLALIATLVPYLRLLAKRRKRLLDIGRSLPDAIEVIIISLRAGQSLSQALQVASIETDGALGEELRRIVDEVGLGRSIDDALTAFGARVPTGGGVRTFVVSLLVLRQTGGNLVQVLGQNIETIRAQERYQRKLTAMTSEARMSANILKALPPGFAVMIFLFSPAYIGKLTTSSIGLVICGLAFIIYGTGILWLRKLMSAAMGNGG